MDRASAYEAELSGVQASLPLPIKLLVKYCKQSRELKWEVNAVIPRQVSEESPHHPNAVTLGLINQTELVARLDRVT